LRRKKHAKFPHRLNTIVDPSSRILGKNILVEHSIQ
jgi:hypothetical protein